MSETLDEGKREAFMAFLRGSIEADMLSPHAVALEEYKFLQAYVPSLLVTSAGGVAPFQVKGMVEGYCFYYRERHGEASLDLSTTWEGACGLNPHYSAGEAVREGRSSHHWMDSFLNLLPQVQRVPFLYDFAHRPVLRNGKNSCFSALRYASDEECDRMSYGEQVLSARGATAAEAYLEARRARYYPWEASLGPLAVYERVKRSLATYTMSETPVEEDERVFLEPEPSFAVRAPEAWPRIPEGRLLTPWADPLPPGEGLRR